MVSELFIGTPPDLAIGMMAWQEMGRQMAGLKKQQAPVPYEEQLKGIHVPLIFNPEAMSWIEQALSEHYGSEGHDA
jgi:hypothetical protein